MDPPIPRPAPSRALPVFLAVMAAFYLGGARAEPLPPAITAFLDRHCVKCHGEEKTEARLDFRSFHTETDLLEQARIWHQALELTATGEMPPKGEPPPAPEMRAFTRAAQDILGSAGAARFQRPGRVTLPRLTQKEFNHTLADLMGIDLHAGASLPEDGPGPSGFRNDREALDMTAPQFEAWMSATESAVTGWLALENPPILVWKAEAEEMTRSEPKLQPHEGGLVLAHPNQELSATVVVPVDGYYRITHRAAALGLATELRITDAGETLVVAPVPSGTVGRASEIVVETFLSRGSHDLAWQNQNLVPQTPLPPDVTRLAEATGDWEAPVLPPFMDPEPDGVRQSREALNAQARSGQAYYVWLRLLGPGGDPREIDRFRKYARQKQVLQQGYLEQLAARSSQPIVGIERLWRNANVERLAENQRLLDAVSAVRWEDWMKTQGKLWLDRMEILGPIAPEKATPVPPPDFAAPAPGQPDSLETFLRRAWRRPVTAAKTERLRAHHQETLTRGATPEEAKGASLTAILLSPHLLYRPEFNPTEEQGTTPLTNHQLAARLSYFLWQSLPDNLLDAQADAGRLTSDPGVLDRETDRLLDDPKADRFLGDFLMDWLRLGDLGRGQEPDPAIFLGFTPALAEAMRAEPSAFWKSLVRENTSLLELLDSRHSWMNGILARHCGIPGVTGPELQRISLPDRRRGGLLGMAGILTATSSPARTNPVRRGAWVLEVLLGEDPGEPLPTAGQLPGNAGEARGRTLREELALHRTRPFCARCHDQIDPPGFALEHFDLAGRWRDTEAGQAVDASATLSDGSACNGLEGLREYLLSRKGDFVRNLARQLYGYALGREPRFHDSAAIEKIAAAAEADGFRARTLILEIVRSEAFRYQEAPRKGATN